jgi:hypothetical protein
MRGYRERRLDLAAEEESFMPQTLEPRKSDRRALRQGEANSERDHRSSRRLSQTGD